MRSIFPRLRERLPLVAALGVLLLLVSCTRVGLVYRNLDVLVPWSVNEYLSMTTEQEQTFKTRLQEHLAWHCKTQLPAYLEWLNEINREVETGQVTEANLRARLEEAKGAIEEIAKEITPSTVQLLRKLTDAQVQELYASLDKDMRQRREKLQDESWEDRLEERTERMEKRLGNWLGRLSPAQRQRVSEWAQTLGDQNGLWLDNRARWQAEFRDALAQRQADGFPARIARLLQRREELWSEQYRQTFARNEQAAIRLLVDVMALADDKQRTRLLNRLDGMHTDFASLACLNGGD